MHQELLARINSSQLLLPENDHVNHETHQNIAELNFFYGIGEFWSSKKGHNIFKLIFRQFIYITRPNLKRRLEKFCAWILKVSYFQNLILILNIDLKTILFWSNCFYVQWICGKPYNVLADYEKKGTFITENEL